MSSLCKLMDEKNLPWDKSGLRTAVKELLKANNTLFDDVIKNIRNHPEFSDLAERIRPTGTVSGSQGRGERIHAELLR